MLLSGAREVNQEECRRNLKSITLLSILTTAMSALVYGLIFYIFVLILGLGMDIFTCIFLGCVVSPTDPIAATGILNKLRVSSDMVAVIEAESLFNDGTGVALIISFVRYAFFKISKEPLIRILISIASVAMIYIICDRFQFSGAIASVVCGMYFRHMNLKLDDKLRVDDPDRLYSKFWK